MSINHTCDNNGETTDDRSKHPSSEGHLWFRQQMGGRPTSTSTWTIGGQGIGPRQRGVNGINERRGGESEKQQEEEITTTGQQQNINRERRKAFRASPVDEEDYTEENNA